MLLPLGGFGMISLSADEQFISGFKPGCKLGPGLPVMVLTSRRIDIDA